MIVKNEAHCLEKCLQSVKSYIDYYIICDTGSTDNTINIIKEILKDIPGEIIQNEWIDFSTNRNISLNIAKTKADYIIFIDADDCLIVKNEHCFDNLNKLAYSFIIKHDSIFYERICLISSKIDCRYVGILHEYLETPINIVSEILEDCNIYFGGNGNRSKDLNKYLKDAQLLEKVLVQDPNNCRYTFYCAQSYKDAGNLEKAAYFYEKRSNMDGWKEEASYAALELGKIAEKLNYNITDIINIYTKSYNLSSHRVESIVYLCSYLRKNNMFQLSYFYSKIGIIIMKPKIGLFIENDCYDWKILDELSIAAFYIGKYQEAYETMTKLLMNNLLPSIEKNRIQNNLKFVVDKIL